ncbi:MAG TPA: hypothetical protein PKG48_10535, partial [Bacteroidales bacterium]|nr:hypothetical protein [Bacteroidales bacterium]
MNTVKLFSFKWITISIILILSCTILTRAGQGNPAPPLPRVAFIAANPYETAGDPVRKAYDWLKNCAGFTAEYLDIPKAAAKLGRSGRYQAVWICRMDTNALTPAETGQKFLKALDTYVRNGGRLLLSHQAMHYLNLLGFEDRPVQDSTKRCTDDGYGRRLGFHAFHDHPVFQGLNGGTYTCRPRKDISVRISGFFGNNVPSGGKVVAVDWDYIFLRENSKLIVEYQAGKGKVLAVGGYMDFSIQNDNRIHLERFTGNCLHYLTDDTGEGVTCYWDYSPAEVRECLSGPESDRLLVAPPAARSWMITPSDIALSGRFATGNFWDVASERIVTMGVEKGGIEEVWAPPFMAFRDYEVGIRFSYRDTIYWLNDDRPEITVDPAFFSRKYKFQRAYLTETVVNDPNDPAGVIHYEYRGVYPAELIIRFTSNLRLMWPYSEQATGSVCHRWNGELEAFSMADHTGRMTVMLGGNRSPSEHQSGRYSSFAYSRKDSLFHGIASEKVQASGLLSYNLAMNDNLDIVYAASSEGYDTTCAVYQRAVQNPEGIFRGATGHVARLFHESLLITTPDAVFNKGYRWAIAATDRFFVHTPGMGKAMVAGYSTTR